MTKTTSRTYEEDMLCKLQRLQSVVSKIEGKDLTDYVDCVIKHVSKDTGPKEITKINELCAKFL